MRAFNPALSCCLQQVRASSSRYCFDRRRWAAFDAAVVVDSATALLLYIYCHASASRGCILYVWRAVCDAGIGRVPLASVHSTYYQTLQLRYNRHLLKLQCISITSRYRVNVQRSCNYLHLQWFSPAPHSRCLLMFVSVIDLRTSNGV